MTPTLVDVLVAARALIAEPGAWTQRAMARMACGSPCSAQSPLARAWCAEGAIDRITSPDDAGFEAACDVLVEHFGYAAFDWNDVPERTQAEVLDAFTRAITTVSGGVAS